MAPCHLQGIFLKILATWITRSLDIGDIFLSPHLQKPHFGATFGSYPPIMFGKPERSSVKSLQLFRRLKIFDSFNSSHQVFVLLSGEPLYKGILSFAFISILSSIRAVTYRSGARGSY